MIAASRIPTGYRAGPHSSENGAPLNLAHRVGKGTRVRPHRSAQGWAQGVTNGAFESYAPLDIRIPCMQPRTRAIWTSETSPRSPPAWAIEGRDRHAVNEASVGTRMGGRPDQRRVRRPHTWRCAQPAPAASDPSLIDVSDVALHSCCRDIEGGERHMVNEASVGTVMGGGRDQWRIRKLRTSRCAQPAPPAMQSRLLDANDAICTSPAQGIEGRRGHTGKRALLGTRMGVGHDQGRVRKLLTQIYAHTAPAATAMPQPPNERRTEGPRPPAGLGKSLKEATDPPGSMQVAKRCQQCPPCGWWSAGPR